MSEAQEAVLLVEDDSDFPVLIRRALIKAEVAVTLEVIRNGEEAIASLKRDTANLPTLVLLDLKLPKLSGFEVLRWLRSDPSRAKLPVVVLTSSDQDQDRDEATRLGASDFRIKPSGFEGLVMLVRDIAQRWLPKRDPH